MSSDRARSPGATGNTARPSPAWPTTAAPHVPETVRRLEVLAAGQPLDVVVIGGGINGCGIAEELSARGLRVALFEADDFGFGTTWRSTKLIHGGLRYLEHGDVRLVFESLRERSWLLRAAPHLVRPQRFVLPTLPWTRRPDWQLRVGLTLYDLLARDGGLPDHRRITAADVFGLIPFLPPETRGGFTFYDARCIAPERLALEFALATRAHGAFVANHTPVQRIAVENGSVVGVDVGAGEAVVRVPARAVINAAGPWVDAVNAVADRPAPELLGVTRGTHIVVEPERPIGKDGVFSTTRTDGRVFFAVPQDGLLLVGTTDVRYAGDPGAVRPTMEDVDYLLDEARALMPGLRLTIAHVRYAYAGLRPLQRMRGGPEASITRRHALIDHGRRGGPRGLLSLAGGKLSTFRPLAHELAKRLEAGRRRHPGPGDHADREWLRILKASRLDSHVKNHLRRYGPAFGGVAAGGSEVLCDHSGAIAGEVVQAVRNEAAFTLSDVMMRRTGIAWGACRGLCCHRAVAEIVAEELGWDAAERESQVRLYEAEVAWHLPEVGSLTAGGECVAPA